VRSNNALFIEDEITVKNRKAKTEKQNRKTKQKNKKAMHFR